VEKKGRDFVVKHAAKLPIQIPSTLPPEDIKWTTVSLSEVLERNARFKASVYDIAGKHAREVLSQCKWKVVNLWSEEGLIQDAFYPTRFKRIYVKKNGISFFMPSQLNELLPKPTKFISPKTSTNLDSLPVKANQVLLTRSGTIGNCAFVSKTLEGKVFSDDVIRIELKNPTDYSGN
jgi:type I restriction enzyme, S subunit